MDTMQDPATGTGHAGTDAESARLEARVTELGALAAAIRSGSPYPEDRHNGRPDGPADNINTACARLRPDWDGGPNELLGIAALDEAREMLDARAAESGVGRDRDHAAAAKRLCDLLWGEYRPRDVTGTLIEPGDEIIVTRPDGTTGPLDDPEGARVLPAGAMRIINRATIVRHPADQYPNLLTEGNDRRGAARCAAEAIRYGRWLPFGKHLATVKPWQVGVARNEAVQHLAFSESQRAKERNAPQAAMREARAQYDCETGEAPGGDTRIPPALARTGPRDADGFIPGTDQEGRRYRVRYADGTVTVTFHHGSLSAACASPAAATRVARELAGTLTSTWWPPDGPDAALAAELRRVAAELLDLDPDPTAGRWQVDYSGAAPKLLEAAILLDRGHRKDGLAALSRAIRELGGWVKDDDFRDHIGNRSNLTAGLAARYADTLKTLRKTAG